MRMCQDHWGKLKAALDERGLGGFVAKDGEEAAKRLVGEHATEKANFDPLMGAYNAILARALAILGLALFVSEDEGAENCPLCMLQKGHNDHCANKECTWTYEATWIPGAADAAREEAIRLGFVASDKP